MMFPLSTMLAVQAEPKYLPSLSDGTLLTTTFDKSARDVSILLFIGGMLLAVFIRNILVAIHYVRTVSARDKRLFHLLLFAQVWGPIAVLAMLLPLAVDSVNCTAYVSPSAAPSRRAIWPLPIIN